MRRLIQGKFVSLIDPPPVVQPHLSAPVVPGGPVYTISGAIWDWMTGKGPFPWSRPTPPPPVPPAPRPKPIPPSSIPSPVVDAQNAQRAKYGLAPQRVDQKLTDMAQRWANDMATDHLMSHAAFSQRMQAVYANVWAGENVAEGASTVPEVMGMWMNSPGHRANILNPKFTAAGAGMATASDGTVYWCVDFAGV